MAVNSRGFAKQLLVFSGSQIGRHGLPRRRKFEPVIRVASAIDIKRRAAIRSFDQMNRNQLCTDIIKQRRDVSEKLARDVFGGWGRFTKRRVVFVQKLMVELVVDHSASAFLDFADIDQHSGDGIDPTAENKISDVISSGPMPRAT